MRIVIAFLFILFCLKAKAQQPELSIYQYEDSLKNLGQIIINDTVENNRIKANENFIKTLISSLKTKGSFNYKFDKLENIISIKTSDDKKFRIFSWFVFGNNGNFRYYGAIQLNNSERLELIPLIDGSLEINQELEQTSLPNNKWYGAVYYNIIPVFGKKPYYILLGWKGQDMETSSKVIETLSIQNGKAIFGETPVFQESAKSQTYLNRRVFFYNSSASMLLKYVKDDKVFVFDHLIPPNEEFKEVKNKYVPDLSYDGYRYRNGKWTYIDNMNLKNLPDDSDDSFVDPSKINPGTAPIRKY